MTTESIHSSGEQLTNESSAPDFQTELAQMVVETMLAPNPLDAELDQMLQDEQENE